MTGSFIEVYLSITKPFKCKKRESMSVYENDKPKESCKTILCLF